MKRMFVFAAVTLLLSTAGLWAAGQGEAVSSATAVVSDPGELPIVSEPVTLTFLAADRGDVDYSYEANYWTRYAQDNTNVRIKLELVPEAPGDAQIEKTRVIIASGDYPDVYYGLDAFSKGNLLEWGSQGILHPLNDLIEEQGFNLKQVFANKPAARGQITAPDGNIYGIPAVNECYHCSMSKKMWINEVWLERLGLDMPETTGDFYDVLKAFKEQDPNGNGKADEIPLAGANGGWWSQPWQFIMHSFIYVGSGFRYIDDGTVKFAATTSEWREGLKYLYTLYSDGLLDRNAFSQSIDDIRTLMGQDEIVIGTMAAGYRGNFNAYNGNDLARIDEFRFVTVAPLIGPDGYRSAHYSPPAPRPGAYVISSSCENKEVAFKWGDWLLDTSGEVTLRGWYGPPASEVNGQSYWDWPSPGATGMNGKPAIWKATGEEMIKNSAWAMDGHPVYWAAEIRGGMEVPPDANRWKNAMGELLRFQETKNNYEPYIPDEYWVDPWFTTEELEDLSIASADISTIVEEYVARFITGDLDIYSDADWNNYVNLFNKTGLDEWLEISQEAWDRTADLSGETS